MKRKICVVTGSRSEYGLLRPLLREIKKDASLTLQLAATGMHLSREFGLTYKDIENDGFHIDKKVDIHLGSDTPVGIAKSIGIGIEKFTAAYGRLKPDIVVLLGDRFEILSAAIAAHLALIPIAHLCGGAITEGAVDNAFRHSITKMSSIHFTSTEQYRNRVIQLGEHPSTVFNVGALGVENIKRGSFLSREELEEKIAYKFREHNLLVVFHPATLDGDRSGSQFEALLKCLRRFKDTGVIFIKPNADAYGRTINRMIDAYVLNNPCMAASFKSLNPRIYLSIMKFVDAIVGNSSSGIVEAPSFAGVGTINIGDRQKGRIRAKSIIDCEPTAVSISRAIKKLYSGNFQKNLKYTINPYKGDHVARKIKDILKICNLKDIVKKQFYNML